MSERIGTGVKLPFQYKICYSKIMPNSCLKMQVKNFNTKFVIAKFYWYIQNTLVLYPFQYKICYSKIKNRRAGIRRHKISIQNLL